ncbi:MAG: NAD(P)H-hydrate dehydratase [Tissierellaceae bacterium]|nr:NAD(P)H-hydrate dehydratase [Tissierellaceae bacterium]
MKDLLAKRNENTHKGSYGRVAIIAGGRGMTGAPYLASKAALRTGSGLVYSIIPESLETIMCIKLTEAIIRPINDRGTGHFVLESLDSILKEISNMDSIALGPGIGVDRERVELVSEIIKKSNAPMVIDADGLNCISKDVEVLNNKINSIIITPHPGEMARLLNTDIKSIEEKRQYYAQYISGKYGIYTVLKGHETIVASPDGEIYINTTGNAGMATAGSGDVLTGIIVSLLGQSLPPFNAAKLGVYLHGLAGDIARDKIGEYGMIATDILESIPYAISGIVKE